ncbi:MAG: hypothetical protein CL910_19125 [Deltaproteobacteria bacterium]|nr:hypothetical protein [Deltaproteobacteria bacterium]
MDSRSAHAARVEPVAEGALRRDAPGPGAPLVGSSAVIHRVREWLWGLAPLCAPVLLAGEPGTGRWRAAHFLHEQGLHPGAPFVQVDAREGRALEAIPLRGTLFLMGLESLSDEAQARWLPLIEGTRSEARILASASPTLFDAITSGSFDATLARLLTRFEVRLPSLRERMEDLPELVSHLAREVGAELGRTEASFTDGALRRLGRERWPGNLHELRRVVERLIAFTPAPRIGLREVEAVLEELRPSVADLRERQQLAERRELLELLDATGGNVAETAARMGRSRASIYRLVEKHGIALRRGS